MDPAGQWLEKTTPLIKKAVTPSRFKHIQGVTQTALKLARLHGLSELKAAQAGLLHDCAKNMAPAALKRQLGKAKADKWEIAVPPLWHAVVGALLARERYGVKDREVLTAIRYHPCAKAGMTDIQKCLFVADFIEPGRKFKGLGRLRKLAREDLHKAFVEVMREKMGYLLKRGKTLHPKGIEAWNELVTR